MDFSKYSENLCQGMAGLDKIPVDFTRYPDFSGFLTKYPDFLGFFFIDSNIVFMKFVWNVLIMQDLPTKL